MWLYYFSTFRRVVLQLYRQVRYSPPYILGTGGGGNMPPEGRLCPHSQSMPASNSCPVWSCCNRPDYEVSHKISKTSSYKVCSDQLTIHFFIRKLLPQWSNSIINAKQAWFQGKVGIVVKFSRTLHAIISNAPLPPPNLQHLPMPMYTLDDAQSWTPFAYNFTYSSCQGH